MDTVLIPSQQIHMDGESDAAKAAYQEQLKAHVASVDAARVVPAFVPVLTLEQRVAALEKKVTALENVPPAEHAPPA